MKKVLNISLGNRSFAIEEDAYKRLSDYLKHFRTRLAQQSGVSYTQNAEVMEDLESRIAELLLQEVGTDGRVVGIALVDRITGQLGMPDGAPENPSAGPAPSLEPDAEDKVRKKIYRDYDNKRIAGVCAGLATYLDIDVVLTRILMLVALIAGTAGFWIYVICWIAIPKAVTATQKCEMYGLPVTAENLAKFATTQKQ
ncbi:MAG: PspC domain-containing protein [Bacteroidales bacterium]|nr:PspC domain-containing protein [Bacteroidales bacterium]